jgi:hypothetical protein
MTTYLSGTALVQLDHAQAELERHLVTGVDGRCASCRELEPCGARVQLHAVFAQYGRLPKRTAGVTRAGLRRSGSADTGSWFGG